MSRHSRSAFTLIELLVVIAIIAILGVVVVLTLNPAELLRQSRDANRVSDLATINTAIGIYAEDSGGQALFSLGNASSVYVSLPDTTSTCANLGLPSLAGSNYTSYACTSSTSTRNVNGNGWIPINFQSISSGAPIGSLPQDPTNQTSTGLYYAYVPGAQSLTTYEVTARLESQKQASQSGAGSNDGGYSYVYDEQGKDLTLALNVPKLLNRVTSTDYIGFDTSGLAGYWPLNEGQGSTAVDQSGNGNNGIWSGTQGGTSGYYSAGKVGQWAGYFNGSSDIVTSSLPTTAITNISLSFWINIVSFPSGTGNAVYLGNTGGSGWGVFLANTTCGTGTQLVVLLGNRSCSATTNPPTIVTGTWYHVALTRDASTWTFYLNGVSQGTGATIPLVPAGSLQIGATSGASGYLNSLIGDVRVYNRTLSASEVQAIYNSEK